MLLLAACTTEPTVGKGPDSPIEEPDTAAIETIGDGDCDPGAAPVYGEEGQPLSFRVACTGPGTATAFSMPDLPAGASFDGETVTWTPGYADAGHYPLAVIAAGDTPDVGTVDVWVADAWSAPENEPVDPLTYTEEYGLPVFHLERPDATNEYTDVATTVTYRGESHAIELKYRGAASLYYPKKSYTLSFAADDEFEDADEGFQKRHKIVLTTLFDDNAYVRQILCYQLWNQLDPTRHVIQTMLAVVYINGEYEGLYLASDHIDGEFWEDYGYDEDGNLYKSVTHEANFYTTYDGVPKSSWHAGYEKQEGDPYDYSDLDAFVQFAATSSDADFYAGIESWMPIDEIADWWILVRFTEADDSGGKNAYLYRDATTGLFHHAPWDFNHSFGQTWQTERETADTNYDFFWSNNLFLRLLADPTYGAYMESRLQDAMEGPFAADAVNARIDQLLARAEPSAQRDWEKWQDQYRSYWYWRTDFTSHDEEVAYLEQWVTDREGYMWGWYP